MTEPLRILLLEDSRFDAELLRERLRLDRPDALLEVARSEEEFMERFAPQHFDAVLSDFEIPGWDGAQALSHVRARAPHLPFIFVSGVIGEDNAVDLLKLGATDYVSKGRLERLGVVLTRALAEAAERDARARAEREAEAARERAEEANRTKDRFLAILSHELRTPLTPIAAALELLEASAVVPAEQAHLLPMIRRNLALEARLIDDLLDVSAISAGKIAMHPAPVDMHALIQHVARMLENQAAEKNLRLALSTRASRTVVLADETRMHQILWNLVRNAIKFSEPGGQVRLVTRNEGERFVFVCEDDGIGIERSALPRIFTLFEQASDEVARQYGGLGLGLAIARSLVREHGGELSAASEGPGRGAAFTLWLGLHASQTPPGPAAAPAPCAAAPDGAAGQLLLVEDNADSAEVLAMGLELFGWQVRIAATRAAGLAALEASDFDAVITDLGLPDGSGLAIGEALGGRLPVIALSGWGASHDVEDTRAKGFAAHVTKPADLQMLDRLLREALEARVG